MTRYWRAVSDEFGAIPGEPELGGEGVPVVLPGEPVGACGQPRLEDMGRMRPAPQQIPLVTEAGEEQLRLVAGEHCD